MTKEEEPPENSVLDFTRTKQQSNSKWRSTSSSSSSSTYQILVFLFLLLLLGFLRKQLGWRRLDILIHRVAVLGILRRHSCCVGAAGSNDWRQQVFARSRTDRENPFSLSVPRAKHKTPNTRHRPQPKRSLTAADLPLGEHSENSLGNVALVDRSGVFL